MMDQYCSLSKPLYDEITQVSFDEKFWQELQFPVKFEFLESDKMKLVKSPFDK